jgi:hypothetical protein
LLKIAKTLGKIVDIAVNRLRFLAKYFRRKLGSKVESWLKNSWTY